MNSKALVLFSGGQDSTTCLAWALDRYRHVETIGFAYGQRHAIELECRKTVLTETRDAFPRWADKLGEDHLLDLSILGQVSDTALTQAKAIEMQANGLPNTFVPGRNLLFFTFAATIAYRRGLVLRLPLKPTAASSRHQASIGSASAPRPARTGFNEVATS